ncbi:unnamed protein product [Caenorhabditis auriculariae]|uniref:G-protein coupled receptors family 1 profile domain-containing protein n=1 Tax=Caenorhabditis auriculariae TaxID=2777116 RepID=A0A8S1HX85_9PELO|nr:unnamed protein product [Caenorhabditis auriculariae]
MIPLNVNILLTVLTIQRYLIVCCPPRYHEYLRGNNLKYCVWAAWLYCFFHLAFLFYCCDYTPLSPLIRCQHTRDALIVHGFAVVDKLLAALSIVLYYLIYRKVYVLAAMVSSKHYRPEKRVMKQALPFTIAKMLLLVLVLPPWLLNSTFRQVPIIYTFYALDYFLIPTVIPLSLLSSLYQQYKSKPVVSQPASQISRSKANLQ